jgi:hypothetical protein
MLAAFSDEALLRAALLFEVGVDGPRWLKRA